jgi:long-chain fatty acid transport protein
VHIGKLKHYQGLFAESGEFDVPANYGVGLALLATPALKLAADWQRIEYNSVKSVGNPVARLFAGNPLGSANGPGFGWQDISVVKLAAQYAYAPDLTLRAGFSHAGQPVATGETFFNILAPGVVQNHLTLGFSWKTTQDGALSVAFTHGFKQTIHGSNSIPGPFGGGNANVHLQEDIIGIAYGWKLN